MTSSSEFDEALELSPSLFGKQLSPFDQRSEERCSMQVLRRLALTLGVPVESFFAGYAHTTVSDDVTAAQIEELTRAFVAITDPIMRRYCLDVVRAAGIEERSGAPDAVAT